MWYKLLNSMNQSPEPSVTPASWVAVVSTTIRLLTFRATREELINLTGKHLAFGLLCAWIVGIGRYWDNPRVGMLQHLGIGSVVYVFALSLFLWLIVWPLRPKHWTYFRVLTFVSLVSPPAILYAIPVEQFYSLLTADNINVVFLLIVAIWRVALLIFFLRRLGELDWFSIPVATLLPLTVIVFTLTALNLEKAVFDFMGGIRQGTASDGAYAILFLLSFLSVLLVVPLLICYIVLSVAARVQAQQERYRKMYEQ
jgi:hypothetical protein